jgi:dTDP-4-dehydrorhamnose 3,5-epimerase
MKVELTAIPGVVVLAPRRHVDERGFFSETYRRSAFHQCGLTADWVQDNHSCSTRPGVLRGLHFQIPPQAQAKLVRVVRGAIFDVVVDIRRGSPTYGKYCAAELSAENWKQLYLPPGTAHGFLTLTADCEVVYKTSAEYAPDCEAGLAFDDPDLKIPWPQVEDGPILSERDRMWPRLRDLASPFIADGSMQ